MHQPPYAKSLRIEPLEDRQLLSVSVSGLVWSDLNSNGIREASELGVAGAVVEIFSSTDSTIGNTDDVSCGIALADSNGNYSFSCLPDGHDYYEIFRAPVGYTFTTKDVGSDDTKDSDADVTGVTTLFTTSSGINRINLDAGLNGTAPSFGFALRAGVAGGGDSGQAVATDAAGNVYVIGQFNGTVDFDSGPGVYSLTSDSARSAYSDAFVAKYTSTGALCWAGRIGGAGVDDGYSIAVGYDGSVYTTGGFVGTVDFDLGLGTVNLTAVGSSDVFVSKLDSAGKFVWARAMGGNSLDIGCGIAVAPDGSVYTTGFFYNTADFDPGEGTFNLTSSAAEGIFISKLDAAGNYVWARAMATSSGGFGFGIAVAPNGDVWTTGAFTGIVDFNPGPDTFNLSAAGFQRDVFVSKLNSAGEFGWAGRFGGVNDDFGRSISVAPDGSVYSTGQFGYSADFDPSYNTFNLVGTEQSDAYVSKLDSEGNFVWAKNLTGNNLSWGAAIDVASDGTIYVTGSFEGTADFDPGTSAFNLVTTENCYYEAFLWRLDSVGDFLSAIAGGGIGNGYGNGIAVALDGSVYTTGGFNGIVDFDFGPGTFNLSVDYCRDIFVSRQRPDNAPTDITLSANAVAVGQPISTVVGTFASTDPDVGDAFVYTLVAGAGSDDNALFTINSTGQLLTAAVFDLDAKPSCHIRVRTTDYSGMWYEEAFTIDVTNVNEAPVLAPASPSLGTKCEGWFSIQLASTFINNGAGTTTITDGDDQAVVGGIAVVGVTGSYNWWYSLDGIDFSVISGVSENNALLLPSTAQIWYYAAGIAETATITYRAWDATSGVAGGFASTVNNGGDTAFSMSTDTAVLNVIDALLAVSGSMPSLADGLLPANPTSLKIGFNRSTSNADGADHYQLQSAGSDALLGTSDDVLIPLTAAFCHSGDTKWVELTFSALPMGDYRLYVCDTITDSSWGRALDGDGDGTPGGDWTADFVVDASIPIVSLTAPAYTSGTCMVSVDVTDAGVSMPNGTLVGFDLDLNNDGDFDDLDEAWYDVSWLNGGMATRQLGLPGFEGTFHLRAHVRDAAYNEGYSDVAKIVLDRTCPTIAISEPTVVWSVGEPISSISYTVTYDDANFNTCTLTASDITLERSFAGTANGTITVTGEGKTRLVTIGNITGDRWMRISIAPGTASDLAGNLAPGISSNFVLVDSTPPVVTLTAPAVTNDRTPSIDVAVSGVSDDVAVDVVIKTDLNNDGDFDDPDEWIVASVDLIDGMATFTSPSPLVDGTYYLQANVWESYYSQGSSDLMTMVIDTKAPAVTINQAVAQADLTSQSPIHFTVVFSETVTDFAAGDVKLDGTAGATTAVVTGSGTTYNVAVSGMTGSGTVTASIAAGKAHDAANNPNTASTSSDNSVTFSSPGPQGPKVSGVMVVEVNTPRDGILTVSEPLVMTWNAVDPDGVASATLFVDDKAVTNIGGPYGTISGANFAATVGTLAAGTHHYSIVAKDSLGNATSSAYTGSFVVDASVAAAGQQGPKISGLMVVEINTPRDGILTTNEPLVMTWNAVDPDGVASATLFVDGNAVTGVGGPYGTISGANFAATLGALAAGTHHYSIVAKDKLGNATTSAYTGSFDVVAAATPIVQSGPTISGVMVVEVTGPWDGILTVNEPLVMTWNAVDPDGVAGATLSVDGNAVTGIGGPYGAMSGSNFAAMLGTLAAGTHHYSITATDKLGNATSSAYTGSFVVDASVAAAGQQGPKISGVMVVEVNMPRNGILTTNEPLVMTWNAVDPDGVASATLFVDGTAVTGIGGPYGAMSGSNFAATLGTLAAGAHNYSIVAKDKLGNATSSAYAGSFTVTAALVVDASAPSKGTVPDQPSVGARSNESWDSPLTDQQLAPIVAEAERRLAAVGVKIQIADLPDGLLGEAVGNTILIDRDAAGYGWFIDSTPGDDLEYADVLGPHSLAAGNGSAAAQRVDLLTTVMHEMGHVLGYEHSDSTDLMYPTLSLGTRRSLGDTTATSAGAVGNQLAGTDVLDQVFDLFQNGEKKKRIWV